MKKLTPEAARKLLEKIRSQDPVLHYKPAPTFQLVTKAPHRFVCIKAKNQCLGGETLIYDPVRKVSRPISEITDDHHVYAWDGERMVVARALPAEITGHDDLYRITLSNGLGFVAAGSHAMLCADGSFRSTSELRPGCELFHPPTTLGNGRSIRAEDGLRCSETAPDSQSDCPTSRHSRGGRLRQEAGSDQASAPSPGDAQGRTPVAMPHGAAHADAQGYTPAYSRPCRNSDRPSSPDALAPTAGQSAESSSHARGQAGAQPTDSRRSDRQLSAGQAFRPQPEPSSALAVLASGGMEVGISAQNLVVVDCSYVRTDYKWDFEVIKHHNYLCAGAIHHNCGKTSYLQWTTASILRGKHPTRQYFGPTSGLLIIPSRAQAAEVWGKRLLKACDLAGEIGKYPWLPKREIARIDWAYSPVGKYPGKITMKDGSSLMVVLSGDPNSWKRLEGMTFDWVVRDEVAGSENMGDELLPRLLKSHSRFLSGEQPWGGWMIWAATETKFNEEWNDFKTRCMASTEDHVIFSPQPEEAQSYVSMQAREAMKAGMSSQSYQIRGVGDLDAGDLVQIYGKQWDDRRHLLPVDFVPGPNDNIHVGWDPGVEHPTGIVLGATTQDHPHQVKIFKVFEHARESLDYDIECIHSVLLGRRIATFVYDWKANERHKHSESLFHTLISKMEARGYVPLGGYLKSDKRHSVGINSVREYLDPNPFDKTASPLLVLNGSEESGCLLLRSEFINYRGKESTNFTGTGGVVKKDDDALDAVRYLIRSGPCWSPIYACGHSKYAAPRPLAEAPELVASPLNANDPATIRAKLSARAGQRTLTSVARDYSWAHMFARRTQTFQPN